MPVPAQPQKRRHYLGTRLLAFRYAFAGIVLLIRWEHNARIHALATAVVIACGIWRQLSPAKWAILLLCIGGVWTAEAFNTALEMLSDLCCGQKFHPVVKRVKDMAAGAVFLAALTAVGAGTAILFF